MKWFACFNAKPAQQEAKRSLPNIKVSKVAIPDGDLQKQDSAYGLERDALRSQVKKSNCDADALLHREMADYSQLVPIDFSQTDSQAGNAASLKTYGPPKPSCNKARLDNLMELGLLDKAAGDPEIQHIMQLMCTVFNTTSALVALLGEDKVFIHDAINFKKGDFGWRQSLCAHTLMPANHQVMIVDNPQHDARFAHLPLITHGKVRFYAGTPIVSSRGHRLGTVCFVCDQPRKFDAEGSQMLINMAELITREMERDWLKAQEAQRLSSKAQESFPALLRAVDCFNDAVMFVDTSQPKWQILHANSAAQTKLKLYDVSMDLDVEAAFLWDLFHVSEKASSAHKIAPWVVHNEAQIAGQTFVQQNIQFSVKHSSNGQSAPLFNLSFRCAATANIDSNSACVGAPAFLPTTDSNHQFYFVTISLDHSSRNSNQSIISALTGTRFTNVPFDGIELGQLLGRGGYGSVFRGIKQGADGKKEVVAIKVIENAANMNMRDGVPLETSITRDAHHRNIVNTIDFAVVSHAPEGQVEANSFSEKHDSARSKTQDDKQVWMMLEYCDCGSLQEASEKGFFREDGKVSMPLVLAMAKDMAAGIGFLHERGVVHGDLTGGNVLLLSDDSSTAGVVAKVADFGLARNMEIASKIETRTYGTVTHMPPELLEKGIFTKQVDQYAFGVLMWEMWHGVRAWSSLTFAQIITAVVANKKSLKFSPDAPQDYAELASQCMHVDPSQRPSFSQILLRLDGLQQKYC